MEHDLNLIDPREIRRVKHIGLGVKHSKDLREKEPQCSVFYTTEKAKRIQNMIKRKQRLIN